MVTIDVKNAFNTASWKEIIKELESREVSQYLLRVVENYLDDKYLELEGSIKFRMSAGCPRVAYFGFFSVECALWRGLTSKPG